MSISACGDLYAEELYLAGQQVVAGLYREIESGREIHLAEEDFLPASLNGRVAAYVRVRHTWAQKQPVTSTNVFECEEGALTDQPVVAAKPGVSVLLADGHASWRASVCMALKGSGFDVVGEADTGRAALEAAHQTSPDMTLLNVHIRDGNGLDVLEALKAEHPRMDVVMLTAFIGAFQIANAMERGASGYLFSGIEHRCLRDSLCAIRQGVRVVSAPYPGAGDLLASSVSFT